MPNVRDLLETVDYDYARVPTEWVTEKGGKGVEVLVHRCDGTTEFVSQARQSVDNDGTSSIVHDWSEVSD